MNNSDPAIIPTLYLLPVPMSDVSPASVMPEENLRVARSVKHFIVEDIRSARRFLKSVDRSIDIDSLTLTELNEHTNPADVDAMLAPMAAGCDMAVVSEAGCPAVADPGSLAVEAAHRRGYRVRPLVGPNSILLALMASGFNGQSFAFNGYLPVDPQKRAARLRELERRINSDDQTQIFIETPYRNNRLIEYLAKTLPSGMRLCVASDLTGENESVRVMELRRWAKASYDYTKIPAIFLLYR